MAAASVTWLAWDGGVPLVQAKAWVREPPAREHQAAKPTAPSISCRYECICFRTNGYRCLRSYLETCEGRECWQCQDRVTIKARRSCSIGVPIRSCFCKPRRQR